jgi:hypothetical protein
VAIQQGKVALEPRALTDAGARSAGPIVASGASLKQALLQIEAIAEIKTRAFDASLTRLRQDVEELCVALAGDARVAADILAVAAVHAERTGLDIAASAMPAGPFFEAFRVVLDRRTNVVSRSWRTLLRQVRVGIESLPRVLFRRDAESESAGPKLAAVEQQQLRERWPGFWEAMVVDLGIGGRSNAREQCRAEVRVALDSDLRAERSAEALQRTARSVAAADADFTRFQRQCEGLIEAAVESRGFDVDIQVAADLTTLAPLVLAAAVIVKTGGLGSDLAAAGGGALSSFLMEKYVHLLGSSLTAEARERWTGLRGKQLAAVLVDNALERSEPALRALIARNEQTVAELRTWTAALVM